MSRIRTIKPDFFVDDQVMSLSISARLLWIGMWCFCDDQGVHPDSARRLKAEVFPSDDQVSALDVQRWLDELVVTGLVVRFRCEKQQAYLAVPGFAKHQRIDRPTRKYPAPTRGALDEASTSARRVFDEVLPSDPRALDHGMEGKGKEGKGKKAGSRASAPAQPADVQQQGNGHDRGTRGKRLAADWQPSAEERSYGEGRGLDVDAVAEHFRDYWIAQPGARGVKLDWSATWRTWCRKESERAGSRAHTGGGRPAPGSDAAAAARVLARIQRRQDDPGGGRPV